MQGSQVLERKSFLKVLMMSLMMLLSFPFNYNIINTNAYQKNGLTFAKNQQRLVFFTIVKTQMEKKLR